MIEKNTQEAKIRSGAPKRDPICYQTLADIVIPAGTILRSRGNDEFGCAVASGEFTMTVHPGDLTPRDFKRVIAS